MLGQVKRQCAQETVTSPDRLKDACTPGQCCSTRDTGTNRTGIWPDIISHKWTLRQFVPVFVRLLLLVVGSIMVNSIKRKIYNTNKLGE